MGRYDKWGLLATMYEDGVPVSTILEETGYSDRSTVKGTVKKLGLSKRRAGKPRTRFFREDMFVDIDSSEAAYWLGFVTTDGCVAHGATPSGGDGRSKGTRYTLAFTLAVEDIDRVEAFAAFAGADRDTVKVRPNPIEGRQAAANLNLSSKILTRSLLDRGVIPRNKLESTIVPPVGFEADFWRGVFDADGYVSMSKGELRVAGIVSSRHLVEGLRDFLAGKGVQSQSAIYENQGGLGRASQWKCCGSDVTRLRNALFPKGDGCEHMVRKKMLLDRVAGKYPVPQSSSC